MPATPATPARTNCTPRLTVNPTAAYVQEQCQSTCKASTQTETPPSCTIYAWSAASKVCWWRLDGEWGAPGTLHNESGRVSGCLLGSDPSSGTPYVPGCGSNPIAPHPEGVGKFYYGGQGNDIANPRQRSAPASILPVLSRLDAGEGASAAAAAGNESGITLVQSPYDTPIVAFAEATPAAVGTAGVWLKWTRQYHRLGGVGGAHQALPVTFEQDFIAHAGCWRPAVAWLQARYPGFFEPNEMAAATAASVFGTASYADSRGPSDMDAVGAAHYKKMGYMMNWDSSARFPWHGEWIPTAADRFNSTWVSCFDHVAPDQHQHEGCMNVSYAEIKGWYDNQRAHGFNVCQYGNLFEFGWDLSAVWPPGPSTKINCSTAAKASSPQQALLCHTQQLLQDKYGDAVVHSPNTTGASNRLLCGGTGTRTPFFNIVYF